MNPGGSLNATVICYAQRLGAMVALELTPDRNWSPKTMKTREDGSHADQGPWWGIGVLYLMLTPFAVLGYFAFKSLGLVWDYFDGTTTALYAIVVFAASGTLIVAYLIMVVRQIYIEFVVPKLIETRRTAQQRKDRK